MGLLGLTASKPTEVSVGFRRGWFRHIRVAFASAGYLAVIVLAIKMLERQPKEGFGLLVQWGPWPIIVFVFVCIIGSFLSSVNETIRMSLTSLVESGKDGAKAQARQADALSQLAGQGGRQQEEVRRLAIYAAREFPGVYERLDRQDLVLNEIVGHLRKGRGANDRS